jgi:hypothetical protein
MITCFQQFDVDRKYLVHFPVPASVQFLKLAQILISGRACLMVSTEESLPWAVRIVREPS